MWRCCLLSYWLISCPTLPNLDSFSWAFTCFCGVFRLRSLVPLLSWGHFPLCPLVRDGVPLIHAYCCFSSSPALSLRSFLLSFDFPHMLRIPLARCAVYPSLVRFPLPLPRPSRLVFIGIPYPFGNFLGFYYSSFCALALSGLSSTSCYYLFSCRVFCMACASFWLSGSGVSFLGFSAISALIYLFHGVPLLPFELLATRFLASSFISLYTFSSILLPYPASRRLCPVSSFLFIGSFGFFHFRCHFSWCGFLR